MTHRYFVVRCDDGAMILYEGIEALVHIPEQALSVTECLYDGGPYDLISAIESAEASRSRGPGRCTQIIRG